MSIPDISSALTVRGVSGNANTIQMHASNAWKIRGVWSGRGRACQAQGSSSQSPTVIVLLVCCVYLFVFAVFMLSELCYVY